MKNIFLFALLAAAAWFGYRHIVRPPAVVITNADLAAPAVARGTPAPTFACDGRTHCSQMRSCPEATYFLQHCPNTQMDGDRDGVPCESQFCN